VGVDDADVDAFIAKFFSRLDPALSAEERADAADDFTSAYIELAEPESSRDRARELARRVRSRIQWMKAWPKSRWTMPIRYERDDTRRRVVVTVKGLFAVADFLAVMERQRDDGSWTYGMLSGGPQ
jgi:hypothetical protein